jgi:hypothetical protein
LGTRVQVRILWAGSSSHCWVSQAAVQAIT